ncbi:MAG: phospholipase D-like domain-containing protein [Opitutaceae bacterium]|nr:phospholipase D-like domain-containing protein [Opitutaceae bacterium]
MMEVITHALDHPIVPHLFTMGGVVIAFFAIARLLINKHQPGNTLAWLLVILLVPYLGAPLYYIFGGRKMRRLVARKSSVAPSFASFRPADMATLQLGPVRTLTASGTFPVNGNSVVFLETGEETFQLLEREILAAKSSIEIITFILARDETGKRIVALLAQRAREGIRVRLLLDAFGCLFSKYGFVDPIRKAGGEVGTFMPMVTFAFRHSANLRNHRKIAIFDQHTAFVGGHNLAKEYLGPKPWAKRWQDFGAIISGPAAAQLHEVFLADWAFATDQSLHELHKEALPLAQREEGNAVLQVVASGPDVAGDPLYEGLLSMIQEARHSIRIVTPYFIPDEVLFRSLMVRARAGIEVTLIVPARSNHPVTDLARRHYIRELRRAGANIRLYRPGMLHAKAMLIDNRIGVFGSANFDHRSLFVNFEIGVFVYSNPECEAMRTWIETLLPLCDLPASEKPRRKRLVSALAEDFARLLAPLL